MIGVRWSHQVGLMCSDPADDAQTWARTHGGLTMQVIAGAGHRRRGTWHAAVMSRDDPTLAELLAQEDELRLGRFDNDDAWSLGSVLVEEARRRGSAVVVDIERGGQQLFHAALPGTAPDNDS